MLPKNRGVVSEKYLGEFLGALEGEDVRLLEVCGMR